MVDMHERVVPLSQIILEPSFIHIFSFLKRFTSSNDNLEPYDYLKFALKVSTKESRIVVEMYSNQEGQLN